jgi:hypothetical protein
MEHNKVSGWLIVMIVVGISASVGTAISSMLDMSFWQTIVVSAIVAFISYLGILYIVVSAFYFIVNLIQKVEDEQ